MYMSVHTCVQTHQILHTSHPPEMEFFAVVDAGNQTVCLTTKPFLQPHLIFLKGRLLEDFWERLLYMLW